MLENLSQRNDDLTNRFIAAVSIISALKPTPTLPSPIVTPTPVGGPPKIIDITLCDPSPCCWLMHGALGIGEERKSGDIKKIIWDQSDTIEPKYEIYIPYDNNTVIQKQSKVWHHLLGGDKNNAEEVYPRDNGLVKIMNFAFTPGASVEFVRNM